MLLVNPKYHSATEAGVYVGKVLKLAKVPTGWAACISSSDMLTTEQTTKLKLRRGDVMELGF